MRTQIAAVAIAVLALAGCATSASSEVDGPVGDDLDGAWQLSAATDATGTFDLDDVEITLDIDDTLASGNSGCNSYTGEFDGSADGVAFGPLASTRMACQPDSVMKLETRYLKALETVDTAAIDGDTLTLSLKDDELQLSYTEVEETADAELVGPTWTLESIGTADATTGVLGEATLVFGDDGTVHGSAGCGGFDGDYVVGDDDIRFTRFELQEGDCETDVAEQEAVVVDVIGEGFRADIDGDTLTATRTGSGTTLVYRAGDPR